MAQELIDKIRAQAQARGLDPEIAVRIAQVESSLDPSAKAKTSSAQGLFQVVDKTWKEHGGRPGQKTNVDENIRVGLNVLEANTRSLKAALGRDPSPTELYAAHFLGAQGAKSLLSASPDTPVEQLLSARAVKANAPVLKGKSAGDVVAFLEGKMAMPGSRTAAPAAPQAAPRAPMPAPAAGAPKRLAATGDLGAGYQAALALSFLADEDEEGPIKDENPYDREERIARESGTSAADMLAEYKPKNALASIDWDESSLLAPRKMAEGGEVDTVAQAQEGARKGEAYRMMEKYLQARDAVPDIKAGRVPEGTYGMFSATNLPLGSGTIKLNKNEDILRVIGPGVLTHEMAHAVDRQLKQQAIEQRDMFTGKGNQFTEAYEKLVGPEGRNRTEFARMRDPEWAAENRLYRADPREIAAHGMGAFAGKNIQDRAPRHVDASAATDFAILLDLAQRNVDNGPKGPAKIPAFFKKMLGYADGGEVALSPEEREAASRPAFVYPKSGIGRKMTMTSGQVNDAVLQGVSEMPYNIAGAPVDIATMAMRPFGYKNEAPVMGSDWIKQKMTAAGIRPPTPTDPTARALYEVGQIGSSLVNPTAPVRGAVAVSKAGTKAAKELMQDFQAYNRELSAPGASYAVKPKGGVFAYTYQGDSRKKTSELDKLVAEYVEEAKSAGNPESQGDLMTFLRTKAPKYFTTTYGTADDPLRTAIRTMRMEPLGREAQKMPPYMVDAARNPQARGHSIAATDLERAYDEMTGISGMIYRTPDTPETAGLTRSRQISEAMGREGVPVEARNPPLIDVYGQEEFTRYPHGSRILRELVESNNELPPHLQQALRTGEVLYDIRPRFDMLKPENVVEALSHVPASKLKNMSFPEALIQGMQAAAPLRDYKAAIEIAERGGAVPPAALMRYTAPVTPTVGGQWVRLTEPIATKMEGKLMNHSVGGYAEGESYGTAYTGLPYGGKKAFEEGLAQVYSLRDANGRPVVTVEVANKGTTESPKLAVTQIRGRFNSEPPESARGAIFDLLDKLDEGGKLKQVRPNSYSVSPTGERLEEGSMVDWGREYDQWKLNFAE